jgi:membrane associated rhomboid family serine protease
MKGNVFWACDTCGGRALSVELLRQRFTDESINPFWTQVVRGQGAPGRACPSCGRQMMEVPLANTEGAPLVEVCSLCHFVWFDAKEIQALTPRPVTSAAPELSEKAHQALAMLEVQRLAEEAKQSDYGSGSRDPWWQQLPGWFGAPIESGAPVIMSRPWATWLLCLTILAVFFATMNHLDQWVKAYGLIPAQAGRDHGLTFVTSFFLHGGVVHVLGNVAFLFAFGDNVEDCLRWPRYLLLIIAASFVGDLLHVATDPNTTMPCVGASGGIAGVLVFYALQFPRVRLGFLLRVGFIFEWVWLPAWVALVLWIALQFFGSFLQMSGRSQVSATAHLGGAIVGLVLWSFWRKRNPPSPAAQFG